MTLANHSSSLGQKLPLGPFAVWPDSGPSEWIAEWISPAAAGTNCYFRARRRFELTRGELKKSSNDRRSMLLRVGAQSLYSLFVNGVEVGRGPSRGTLTRQFFDTFDITPLLRDGSNWIAALVHCPNVATFKYPHCGPALMVQLDETLGTDDTWEIQTADEWRTDVPMYTLQTGFMEWHDTRKEPMGWASGEDDGPWAIARVVSSAVLSPDQLHSREIAPLAVNTFLPQAVLNMAVLAEPCAPGADVAVTLSTEPRILLSESERQDATRRLSVGETLVLKPQHAGTMLLLEFAATHIGGLEIEVDGVDGAILDIGYGEQLRDGRLPVAINNYRFADRFILRGGPQTVGPTLVERGFRIVELAFRNFNSPIRLRACRAVDRRYAQLPQASFTCNDPLLEDIFAACLRTLAVCATDVFIDCPWREMAFWVNDLLVENVTWLQGFGDSRMGIRCLKLALSQPRADGLIPGVCPSPADDGLVLFATNLFLPTILEELWLYSGDDDMATELLAPVLDVLNSVAAFENQDHLLEVPDKYWNFVDWPYIFGGRDLKGKNSAVVNLLYVRALQTAGDLCHRLGLESRGQDCRRLAEKVLESVNRLFWRSDLAAYGEWLEHGTPIPLASQLPHALSLLCDDHQDNREAIIKAMSRPDFLAPELYLHHYMFRALTKMGRPEAALRLIRQHWGPIAASGSGTIWEAGVMELRGKDAFNKAGSLCHGFATTPIDFMQTVILGIKPIEPGFRLFAVAPQSLGLTHASGSVPTPHGLIQIAWRMEGEALHADLVVPQGTVAVLPDHTRLASGEHSIQLVA